MAIKINTGFEVGAGVPIDSRLLMTKAEMLSANDNLFPEVYFAICKDDGHLYAYNKNSEPNGETGKFSYIATGTYELPTATSDVLGGVKIGETIDILDGVINPKVSTDEGNAVKVSDVDKGLFVEDKTQDIEELLEAVQTLNTFCETNKKFSETLNGGEFVSPESVVDATEVDTMPEASAETLDKLYLYTGETADAFINGCYYKGVGTDGAYSFERVLITESIDTRIAIKIAEIINGAPESFDTLKELADWISTHGTEATELAAKVNTLETDVTNLKAEKLDVYQGGEALDKNVGKILTINEEGNIVLGENVGSETTADKVAYENEDYAAEIPTANVEDALNALIEKLYYKSTDITSFVANPAGGVFKVGETITAPSLTWSVNKSVLTSLTVTDCTVELTDTSATYPNDITTDKTITVSASDGKTSDSASVSYKFVNPFYYGVSASATVTTLESYTEMVKAKGNNSAVFNATSEFIVYAFPQSYGELKSIIDGNGFDNVTDFNVSTVTYNGVAYSVYVSKTPKNCTNFKYTFNF